MKPLMTLAWALSVVSAFALEGLDLKNLVRENSRKAELLMRSFSASYGGTPRHAPGRIGEKKDFAKLAEAAAELDKLASLKEGAPENCDRAKIRHLMARAYSEPLNLRFTREARAAFQEAIALAAKPDDKARYAFDYARFEYRAAEDDQPEKWEDAMRAAYATPGLSAAGKLSLLKSGVPGMDFEKDGWEAVKDEKDVRVRRSYFDHLLVHTSWQTPTYGLDRTGTPEYWLEVCDRAIADLGPKEAEGFFGRRRECLRALGRADEAERELWERARMGETASARTSAFFALGAHYEALAMRYYEVPDKRLMEKAVAAYRAGLAQDPRKIGSWNRELIEAMMRLEDYKGVVGLLGPTFDPKRLDPWVHPLLGDAYYHLGDWANASRVYEAFGDNLKAGERNPPNRLDRRANALYANGRYEECLKAVDKLSDWMVWKDRKAAYRQKLKKLIEAQKRGEADPPGLVR